MLLETKEKAIDYVNKILAALQFSAERLKEAADYYVEMIDKCPGSKEALINTAEKRGITISIWLLNRLEDIGRNLMHYKLMPGVCNIHEAAMLRKLPYSTQSEILDKNRKFPFLLPSGDNQLIDLTCASKIQLQQIIDVKIGHIRSLAEQKQSFIDRKIEENLKEYKTTEDTSVRLVSGKGVVIEGKLYTKATIREWLIQI